MCNGDGYTNYRWYQLEEGSSSEFGTTVTGSCFPKKISSPISLLLQAAQFLWSHSEGCCHPQNQSVMERKRVQVAVAGR